MYILWHELIGKHQLSQVFMTPWERRKRKLFMQFFWQHLLLLQSLFIHLRLYLRWANRSWIQELLGSRCLQDSLAEAVSLFCDIKGDWEPVDELRSQAHKHVEWAVPWRPCHILFASAGTIHGNLSHHFRVPDGEWPDLDLSFFIIIQELIGQ